MLPVNPYLIYKAVRGAVVGIAEIPQNVLAAHNRRKQYSNDLRNEKADLVSQLASIHPSISEYEQSNVLSYYRQKGYNELTAVMKYRSLLATGKRLPSSKHVCAKRGLEFRLRENALLKEDFLVMNAQANADIIRRFLGLLVLSLIAAGLTCFAVIKSDYPSAAICLLLMIVLLTLALLVRPKRMGNLPTLSETAED